MDSPCKTCHKYENCFPGCFSGCRIIDHFQTALMYNEVQSRELSNTGYYPEQPLLVLFNGSNSRKYSPQ